MKRKLLFSVMLFVGVLVFSQKQYIDPQPKPPTYENSLQETHVPSVGSQHIPIGGSDPQFSLPVQNDDWLKDIKMSDYKMESAVNLPKPKGHNYLNNSNHNWVSEAKKIINKGVEGKIEMYKEVPIKETHTLTEDGTWKPKYSSYQGGANNEEMLIKNALPIAFFIGVFIIIFIIVIRIFNKRKSRQNITDIQNIMVDSMVRKGFHSNDMGEIYGKKQSEITPPSLSQSKKGGFSYNGGHNRY
jgi:hypothetical protein